MYPPPSRLPVPPSIRDRSGDSPVVLNVLVGKSVILECESNAVPPPTITWYKNGRMVTESANLRILVERQVLEIRASEVSGDWMQCCVCFCCVCFCCAFQRANSVADAVLSFIFNFPF